ncbi:TolC family protein [Fulvivirgaceae bacterium PWU4]|uniref:TolC family protein n=1 Tax=Chryseosolibacter histidini TaxID=2782349 RepID=A0AAP2GSZ1_9BACT|nr:TolC family protein [Chryseosolibacter histidini]MBT1701122.1 TolC family protein [Chryseosolibacter histidini]
MRTPFINRWLALFALVFFGAAGVNGQSALDNYVSEGLKNNIVLQQKKISLDKALLSLKIASGMFAPAVGIQGNYTSGNGGRNISLPVGDLLNPVYASLNQLTGSDQFPQIENVNQNFLPNNFYDIKVRASMPLVNTDLIYNKKIQQQQVMLQEFEQDIYKRELIRNIKVAYFNYLSATEAVNIYESALTRAAESKRVNESLLSNGRGLQAYILRSQSEIDNIQAQITDAKNQADNAKLYFNFLLNRNGDEPVIADHPANHDIASVAALITDEISFQQREELKQLREAVSLQQNVLKMNKLFWAPKLSGFADLGSQYEDWKFNDQSRYFLFGFQVDVPLFAGFTNRHKINRAQLDVKNSELNQSLVSQQLGMSARISRNAVETAYRSYQSALKQLEAAESYQRLIERGYKEGVNTFIESIDARNQLTSAQLLVTIDQYRVLVAKANYERETAAYELNQ